MSEILEGQYSDGPVRFHIAAYDHYADLFDLILDKLGGSPCEDDEPLDKQAFANEAEKALDHDLVKGVIDEQPQEVTSKQLKLAAEAVYRGVPTIVIEDQSGEL